VPLLGVNRGRSGSSPTFMPQDMLPSVDAALAGKLHVDARPLLAAALHGAPGQLRRATRSMTW